MLPCNTQALLCYIDSRFFLPLEQSRTALLGCRLAALRRREAAGWQLEGGSCNLQPCFRGGPVIFVLKGGSGPCVFSQPHFQMLRSPPPPHPILFDQSLKVRFIFSRLKRPSVKLTRFARVRLLRHRKTDCFAVFCFLALYNPGSAMMPWNQRQISPIQISGQLFTFTCRKLLFSLNKFSVTDFIVKWPRSNMNCGGAANT